MKKELLFQLLDSDLNSNQSLIVESTLIDILVKERIEAVMSRIKDAVYKEVEDMSIEDKVKTLKEKLGHEE